MGLSIDTYNRCYSTLHRLRQLALNCEGINMDIMNFYDTDLETKFDAFINHSDCEGCYVFYGTLEHKQAIEKWDDNSIYVGDLAKLKEEVKELDPYMQKNAGGYLGAWNAFKQDVINEDSILEFL